MPVEEGLYGLLAEFNTPQALVHATEQARDAGYRRMECYTPYPVEEAANALDVHRNRVPLLTLLGGLMGLTTAGLMQVWMSQISYPINVAGRPLFSWPAFIIPAYEWTILFAGLSAAFSMLALNKFFLCLEAHDPRFDLVDSRAFLEQFNAVSVVEVDL